MIYDGAGGDCTGVWESYHPLSTLAQGIPQKYCIGEVRDYQDFYKWDGDFYKNLKQKVEAAIPYEKRRNSLWMTIKGSFLFFGYFFALFNYIYFCTWWSAIILGFFASQVGVNIMHDGNHGAWTSNKQMTWAAGYSLDVVGSSSVVYRRSHNYGHHSCVNHYELDRAFDTSFPWLRLHMNQPRYWYHRYQHLYALALYSATNLGDLFGTFDDFFWMSNFPNRRGSAPFKDFLLQNLVKICWLFYAILIPSYIHGYLNVIPIMSLYMGAFSLGYALFFAVNHWTLDAGFVDNSTIGNSNWGVLQVVNSVNFALDSWLWTNLSGGLNHQIEHHLFPGYVHTNYPEIAKIVQASCKENGLKYVQYPTFWAAIKAHLYLLETLGKNDKPPIKQS
mmetsp:Transcript_32995/g.32696  ORF Transcript_32995/g.32696 Transcript_32995/m.32696 type:complete len:390 (+) Transcript_32995:217-1386(+)